MLIERDKDYKFVFFVYVLFSIFLLLLCVYGFDISIDLALLINSPVYLIIILGLISTGRTFIMDEDGCTVHFGKYRKKYTWNELTTKRIEKHNLPSMLAGRFSCPYLDEAIFSPYKIHKPKVIRVGLYSIFHPFSCIFVNFSLGNEDWQRGRYYEVEENIFREKMKEWGVELDER